MSASWPSRRRTVRPYTVRARLFLGWAMGLVLLSASSGEAARSKHATPADSTAIARHITIDDRGIMVAPSGHATRDSGVSRHREVRIGTIVDVDDQNIQVGDVSIHKGRHHRGRGGTIVIDDREAGLVRVFADAEVPAGERIEGDVVAVLGSVRVEGEVAGNVVAVMGSVSLEPHAVVDGDVVAIGGGLDQAQGATVSGESVSLGFLPMRWGAPRMHMLLLGIMVGAILSAIMGACFMLLFPTHMLRIAATASQRIGGSLVLGLLSAPLMVIAMVLLLVTVIGIPIAFLLPLAYMLALWAGWIAATYVLGCRLLRRPQGQGPSMIAVLVGTAFVAMFFVLGTVMAGPTGAIRTIALFLTLVGALLIVGLTVVGIGAVLLSRFGSRPRETVIATSTSAVMEGGSPSGPLPPPQFTPPGVPTA